MISNLTTERAGGVLEKLLNYLTKTSSVPPVTKTPNQLWEKVGYLPSIHTVDRYMFGCKFFQQVIASGFIEAI